MNLVGSVAEKAGLRYSGLGEKAGPRIFCRQVVEDPIQRTKVALEVRYGFLVEQVDEDWQNFPVFGLPGQILRGDEDGSPSYLVGCLFDDMA